MHILIVEDKQSLASMLKKSFEEKGHTVVLAANGVEGLAQAETGLYDVVVLDIMLPGLNGLEVIRRLREKGRQAKQVPVLALTARDGIADIVTALDLGVDDYLTKPFAMAELMARLRAVARKGPTVQEPRVAVADIVLDPQSGTVTRAGRALQLTRTQFALLEFFMRRAGQVLTRDAILQRVWNANQDIAPNTLEVFVRSLRAKIDEGHQQSLIQTVRGIGYRMETERRL